MKINHALIALSLLALAGCVVKKDPLEGKPVYSAPSEVPVTE